jgi:hypothetical protein
MLSEAKNATSVAHLGTIQLAPSGLHTHHSGKIIADKQGPTKGRTNGDGE